MPATDLGVAQVGAYVERTEESISVAQVGAFVEYVERAFSVCQVGAYVEIQSANGEEDKYGPRIQVI